MVYLWLFFKTCWAIIKTDLLDLLFFFLPVNAQFDKSLNATFISLIPKKSYAMEVRDFRPVSLIGGCTKLLRKF